MADALHLPLEIIEIIVSKLSSVKSLLRFKSVSRSWNTIISDPLFARNHHQRSKDSNSQTLFLRTNSNINSARFSLVKLDDRKLHTVRQVLGAPNGWQEVLCFCKGLLLLSHKPDWIITLWNPSTGQQRSFSLLDSCHMLYFRLCHDPITDDFKVVILDWYCCSVYSFRNNSWNKRIKYACCDDYCRPTQTEGVCVDGASYWTLSDRNGCVTRIIYFDPRDDKIKTLQKPEYVEDDKHVFLVDLGGSLCLYCNDADDKRTVRIWRKEKGIDNNSWKTLMNVENVGMSIWWFEPLCFVGNKIVIRDEAHKLVVYNPYEKKFEQFDQDTRVFGRGLVPYVDSPFFPTRNPKPN